MRIVRRQFKKNETWRKIHCSHGLTFRVFCASCLAVGLGLAVGVALPPACFLGRLRAFGSVLDHLGVSGSVWKRLGTSGSVWEAAGKPLAGSLEQLGRVLERDALRVVLLPARRRPSPPSAHRDTGTAPSAPALTPVFGVLPKAQIVGACTPRTCAKDHSDSR